MDDESPTTPFEGFIREMAPIDQDKNEDNKAQSNTYDHALLQSGVQPYRLESGIILPSHPIRRGRSGGGAKCLYSGYN